MALSKITNDLLALGENTSSLNLPKGTTAQRPSSPVAGMVRENTDDNVIEYYNGTEWKQVLYADLTILVDYLVIAGGGGGSYGGGGAGGYRTSYGSVSGGNSPVENTVQLIPNTEYSIIVGAGGTGGTNVSVGVNGSISKFSNIISNGGGAGGKFSNTGEFNGVDGSSGGGGGGTDGGPISSGGSGTIGQGTSGGSGTSLSTFNSAGGGGGSLSSGGNGIPNNYGGIGGDGVTTTISGSSLILASGGSGGGSLTTPGPAGGGGSGGASQSNGTSATANTGSGGGGGGNQVGGTLGGQGGSGIVILRLLTSQYSGIYSGSGVTVDDQGEYTVLTYTQSGTYTA